MDNATRSERQVARYVLGVTDTRLPFCVDGLRSLTSTFVIEAVAHRRGEVPEPVTSETMEREARVRIPEMFDPDVPGREAQSYAFVDILEGRLRDMEWPERELLLPPPPHRLTDLVDDLVATYVELAEEADWPMAGALTFMERRRKEAAVAVAGGIGDSGAVTLLTSPFTDAEGNTVQMGLHGSGDTLFLTVKEGDKHAPRNLAKLDRPRLLGTYHVVREFVLNHMGLA